MIGRFLHEALVIGCGPWQYGVVGQVRGKSLAFLVGQDVENALGLGLDGEDAFDGVEGISAEADGPFQGGKQIGTSIRG